ncbi:MAG: glycoside hydrolase family 3 protein, partial [Alphaproteobacteria bacterium]|nr:glycoside hydrolase family 3 protein [Alphaproteobacteria bacterium]
MLAPACVAGLFALATPLVAAAPEAPQWRDLNRNNELDRYEDSRLSVEERVDDLMARMTIEEKVGLMVHASLPGHGSAIGVSSTGYDMARVRTMIEGGKV